MAMKRLYRALDYLVENKEEFEKVSKDILQEDFRKKTFRNVHEFLWKLRDELDYISGEEPG